MCHDICNCLFLWCLVIVFFCFFASVLPPFCLSLFSFIYKLLVCHYNSLSMSLTTSSHSLTYTPFCIIFVSHTLTMSYIDLIKRGGNQAVRVNPPHMLDIHLTEHGSDWLWSVYSVFGVLSVLYAIFFFYQEMKSGSQLIRYTMAAPFLISIIQFFQYFTYASNLGWCIIQAEFRGEDVSQSVTNMYPNNRQIFYAKYIAWFLCWPIQLFLVEMTAFTVNRNNDSVPTATYGAWGMIHSLLVQIIGFEFWVICLLVGALIHSTYKWGYWVMGIFVLLCVLGIQIKRQIFELKLRGVTLCVFFIAVICVLLYNVAWGLADGGNAISPDGESVFYGILDECIFAIWPAYLCFIICKFGDWPEAEVDNNASRNNSSRLPVVPGTVADASDDEDPAEYAAQEKAVDQDSLNDSGETANNDDASNRV
ncbi:hypothetical protein TBLA_0D00670 [Henningerozyma blattae CBS 6284]|uniref:30 kDa heat shock protein n=1 Tax=Henningerozyma blattae (strain ATCC 34711 / CBS 6284 / DSM 70876 / NBRC 10599 / NRRL Y-10934 / UCD 77-7) TaxID=1071380 RepID=I2H2H2_HENB6|nr:hypothetical protein TBLA_0D00670 [Tetrapisispora blattae CBS 6284]CCH60574.1 hypothetical protein TBLA_0D00670 [Tetrapisispora blattae CBS 6284]